MWFDDGGGESQVDFERQQTLLYLIVANGIDSELRLAADSPDAIEALRGLLRGPGGCSPCDPPPGATLYRPGDECFRQTPNGHAFVDPVPRVSDRR